MKVISTILLLVAILGFALSAQPCPPQETCKNHTGSFFVSRLWILRPNATFTNTDVINEFEAHFAPNVTNLPGFIEYVGASNITNSGDTSVNTSLIFFYNVFNDSETGLAVQRKAADFYHSGVLLGQITPVRFENGTFDFFFSALNGVNETGAALNTSSSLCQDNITSLTLSTRLWELTPNATINSTDVLNTFKTEFAPVISKEPGFREYAGILLADNLIFFYNVFETPEGGTNANLKAADFVATGTLHGQIQKVDFKTATVEFDFQCERM
jgi:hypothetical protein